VNSMHNQSAVLSAPHMSAASWDLRHPGLIMTGSNGEEIHEFMGMWPLKPDADLVDLLSGPSPEGGLAAQSVRRRAVSSGACSTIVNYGPAAETDEDAHRSEARDKISRLKSLRTGRAASEVGSRDQSKE